MDQAIASTVAGSISPRVASRWFGSALTRVQFAEFPLPLFTQLSNRIEDGVIHRNQCIRINDVCEPLRDSFCHARHYKPGVTMPEKNNVRELVVFEHVHNVRDM